MTLRTGDYLFLLGVRTDKKINWREKKDSSKDICREVSQRNEPRGGSQVIEAYTHLRPMKEKKFQTSKRGGKL